MLEQNVHISYFLQIPSIKYITFYIKMGFCFVLWFNVPVNNYGHVETVR